MSELYIIIVLVSCFEALAQSSVYYANKSKNKIYIVLGLFFYAMVCFLVYHAYDYKGVGIVNAIWSAIDIVLLLVIGAVIFKENISLQEYVGIVFIIVGILLTNGKSIINNFAIN